MKVIKKLTNEYASNLNAVFLNADLEAASYYQLFNSIFKSCLLLDKEEIGKYVCDKDIDIVFIKVDNDLNSKIVKDMKTFMQVLRKENELLPIYFIEDNVTKLKVIEMINNCYCLDGLLPTPFLKENVYRFLYRILKRITTLKDLNSYLEYLEGQLYSTEIKAQEEKHKKELNQTTTFKDTSRENDIRFTQTEKITAVDFMGMLDDGIVDKVEDMDIKLDSLIGALYRIERVDAENSVREMRENIEPTIDNIFNLVESIGYFSVTARAFESLKTFLSTLSVQEFENKSHKDLLVQMLLAVIHDLEKWLKVIFIENSTDDIHYLDASFSSNVLEIENIFSEDDDDDDDDLEFF